MKTKVQALFRRGCANSSQEDWQQAIEDFNLVLELEPGSDAARRELEKAKEQERRQGSGPTPTRQDELGACVPAHRRAIGALDDGAAQQELDKDKLQASGLGSALDATSGKEPDLSDPDTVSKMAQREADRFKREILALADGHGGVPRWCQRFNKMQVQAAAWTKHQLADPEGLQDLITLRGPVFAAMSEQQMEDFITACEFMSEARARYGDEIDHLLASARR